MLLHVNAFHLNSTRMLTALQPEPTRDLFRSSTFTCMALVVASAFVQYSFARHCPAVDGHNKQLSGGVGVASAVLPTAPFPGRVMTLRSYIRTDGNHAWLSRILAAR